MITSALIQMLKKIADKTAWLNLISQVKSLGGSAELPGGRLRLFLDAPCGFVYHAVQNLTKEGRHAEGGHEHPYFGCVFAMNIALNSFSLRYISIAVNLIIRSWLPASRKG